jgi:trimethylamine--corrinoid protein Co-methyltransferase
MSTEHDIVPASPRMLGMLGVDDVKRIHEAALAFLEQVGIEAHGELAREALLGAGATAGDERGSVKLPAALVEKLVARAPRAFTLAGLDAAHDVAVDGETCLLAAGGGAARVRATDGAVRRGHAADLAAACAVADHLPEIGLVAGPPVRVAGLDVADELAICRGATAKHVQFTGLLSAADAAAAVAAAEAVAAAASPASALRDRPSISLIAGPDGLDAAIVFARAGLPVGALAGSPPAAPAQASPAPPDDLGAVLALANAAALAACAAVQAAAPGAPFFYVASPRRLGWRFETAAANVFALAAGQLARRAGLPLASDLLTSGSPEPDWQASTQNSFAGLSALLGRSAVLHGAGLLAGGDVFSLEQLVMDAEVFSVAVKIAGGIEVDDETIALETIAKVGIGGNYLSERHTRRHMKDVWRPRLLDRTPWDAWVAGGKQTSYDKAAELVRGILDPRSTFQPGHQASPGRTND